MSFCLLSFGVGCAVLEFFSKLPSNFIGFFLLILSNLLSLIFFMVPKLIPPTAPHLKLFRNILLNLIFLLLGFNWACYRAHFILKDSLSPDLINKTVLVSGRIVSLPATLTHPNQMPITRFDFLITQMNSMPTHLLSRLTWYGEHAHLSLGETWNFSVRLKKPIGLRNPGGFDYQREMFTQGIRATGYVVGKLPFIKLKSLDHGLSHWRQIIFQHIQASVTDPKLAAILCALSLGFKGLMTPDQWQAFQRTGTYHLVVIAGLHIGFVSGLVFALIRWLWGFFPSGMLLIPAQRVGAIAALLVAFAYSMLAGFSIPTQRAVIMIAAMLLANLFCRTIALWRRLLFAAFLVWVFDPLSIMTVSFWLSFSSVLWIAYGLQGRLKTSHGIRAWFSLQWALFLGLAPITIYFFQQMSLVAFIANMFAIPWVGMVIVPMCLVSSIALGIHTKLGDALFAFTGHLLSPVYTGLAWFSKGQWVVWHHAIISLGWLILFSIGTALLLAPIGFRGRWLGIAWLLPLFYFRSPDIEKGAIHLTLLDVGQGLSAVLQTKHHVMVFDTGPKSFSGFDAGENVVVPFLRFSNIKHLNLMMISHGDNDHIGGSSAVLENFKVDTILTSVSERFTTHSAAACFAGQHWEWDGVSFTVLSPPAGEAYQGNNSSCVLRVEGKGGSVLLTGDIERARETWLIAQHDNLQSTILIAPHHGSKTSSSTDFINAVNPIDVLFPAGAYNKFHFPNRSVVYAYQNHGVHTFCTGEQGAVTVDILADKKVEIKTMEDHKYYWE